MSDRTSYRCLSRSGSGKFADCFQISWELVVLSDPGDPVVMYADIEGESDNPSPIGGTGSGAAVADVNIALSSTSEVGPRLPEIMSADNPNSSADAPDSKWSSDLQKGRYTHLREETCHGPRPEYSLATISRVPSSLKLIRYLSALTWLRVRLCRHVGVKIAVEKQG